MKKDNRCRNDINYIIFIIKFISQTGRVCCTVHCMLQCTGSNAVLVTIAYIHIFCSLHCESVDISTPRCRIITFFLIPSYRAVPLYFPLAPVTQFHNTCVKHFTHVLWNCAKGVRVSMRGWRWAGDERKKERCGMAYAALISIWTQDDHRYVFFICRGWRKKKQNRSIEEIKTLLHSIKNIK